MYDLYLILSTKTRNLFEAVYCYIAKTVTLWLVLFWFLWVSEASEVSDLIKVKAKTEESIIRRFSHLGKLFA